MRLSEAIDTFIKESKTADSTKLRYLVYLRLFLKYMGDRKLEDIKVADITKFRVSIDKSYAVYGAITAIKSLFNYFYKYYDYDCLPSGKIVLEKPNFGSFGKLTEDQFTALLALFKNQENDIYELRNYCIVLTFYSTGCRANELVNLRRDEIDWENRKCTIIGKGSKERVIYFTPECVKALKRYIQRRTDDSPHLFVQHHHNLEGLPLKTGVLRMHMIKWGDKLGFKIHPHALRKTFASTYYKNSDHDLLGLQKMLGHSSPATTSTYAIVEDLQDTHDMAMSPNQEIKFSISRNGRLEVEVRAKCRLAGPLRRKVEVAMRQAVEGVLPKS